MASYTTKLFLEFTSSVYIGVPVAVVPKYMFIDSNCAYSFVIRCNVTSTLSEGQLPETNAAKLIRVKKITKNEKGE